MSQMVQTLRALRSMPSLPTVAQQVLEVVRDPDYSIDSFVSAVKTDPALTSRILRLCNSSLLGMSRQVTTVGDALAYLGTRNVVKLVLVTCTANYFKAARGTGFASPHELWRHTIACATACQFLAERCGYKEPATAYTAGILHNVGKVALSQLVVPELLQRAALQTGDPDADWVVRERELLGLDHADAGGIVIESWNLPAELRHAVRKHHNGDHLAQSGQLTCLLHVADQMVLQMHIGVMFLDGIYAIDPRALQQLHLGEGDVEAARAHVAEELARSADLLKLYSTFR